MSDNNFIQTASETIDNHEIFGDLLRADEKQFLMDRGIVRSYSTGQFICRQLERESSLYIVLMGEVEVSEGDKNNKLVLAHLGKGQVFGEISALFRIPRISNVLAAKPTVVLEIAGDIFEDLIEKNPTLLNNIIELFGNRLVETALRSVSFFRYMPIDSLRNLIDESSLLSISPGNVIVREGESGDGMYILVHGAARVTNITQGQVLPVAIIGPGDYFGEWSVLTGAPRTATVTALSHIELIRFERETILKFIQENPEVRDRIDQTARMRHDDIQHELNRSGTDKLAENSIKDISSIMENNS